MDKIEFLNIGDGEGPGLESGAGLWIVPCKDLSEKQFVVCLRGGDSKAIAEANPEFRFSEALNGYYRYLSAGSAGKEIVVSFYLPENSTISASLEKWKMKKDIPIADFIGVVYLVKNFGTCRILEKA